MLSFKYNNIRFLPAICLPLFLLFLPSCNYFREKGLFLDRDLKKALLLVKQDSIRVADSLKKAAIITEVAEKTQSDSAVKFDEEKLPGYDTSENYYVIVGTYANPENARSVVRKYSQQGYNTSIISTTTQNGNKAELVSVKTFNNHDDAVVYLRDFQSKVDSKAWVYPRQ